MRAIIVFLSFALILATQPALSSAQENKKPATENPKRENKIYQTREGCESDTRKPCSVVMCDHVPEGKTFEEVCGKDFQEGWSPTQGTP